MRLFLGLSGIVLGSTLVISSPARAVVVLGGRDVNGNLNGSGQNINPAPSNLDSYEGAFTSNGTTLAATGTAIAPHYFVTAAHLGEAVGSTFALGGTTYTTVASATSDDLEIFETDPSGPAFSTYAPLYTASTEVGSTMVAIGRGGGPGTTVTLNGTTRGVTNTAATPNQLSWSEQPVASIYNPAGSATSQYLDFNDARQTDSNGNVTNPDQGGVSAGDGGGGVFVRDPADGVFKLAGVISFADGPFNPKSASDATYSSSQTFYGTLYDATGFYYANTSFQVSNYGAATAPTNSYAQRISTEMSFIDSFVDTPEPSSASVLLVCGFMGLRRSRRPLAE